MKNYEMRVFPKKAEDGSVYWTAHYPSVPDCVGGGDTPEEAMKEAQENLEFYLEYLEEEHKRIPAEDFKAEYSGKVALRIPKSTHKKVAEIAENEGVSINTLLVSAIENYIGTKSFDMQLDKKIDALKMVADSSLELQQCNTIFSQCMWENTKNILELVSRGDVL